MNTWRRTRRKPFNPQQWQQRKSKRFGDNAYAVEELVAELAASFISAEFGIMCRTEQSNHASYIDNWLSVLKSDKHAVLSAASAASKAAEYLHSL
jgi:antirestriction protein ArdC